MRRNRTLSCFVPLPRTENAYTVKPNKEHSPTALFRLETKKVVYTCEQGSATIMFKWANSYYVRDVVKSCLADKLLSVQKSVQNLFSKLSIESVTEPSLTPTTQSIGANIQTLLQSRKDGIESVRRLPLIWQSFHAIVVPAQRICTCTI